MIRIRVEEQSDYVEINQVIENAFGKTEECRLVERIRQSENYIEELSLVAVEAVAHQKERVVGHLMMSRIQLENESERFEALALAPVSVIQGYQGKGIGQQLMKFALEEAKKFGHQVVTVLGHPDYYPKAGFEISDLMDIHPPFQVRRQFFMAQRLNLAAGTQPYGKVVYPSYFYE